MNLNYSIKQLNSGFSDNAFFIRNIRRNGAFLLDCGKLGGLDNSSLLDVTDIFVSHTHIDHFNGFDRVLRSSINSDNTIRFFGPEGFTRNVAGKLAGYTWNLITDYDVVIEAIEIAGGRHKRTVFSAKNSFEPVEMPDLPSTIDLGNDFTLKYCEFDHGITSMGYRICEPTFISVKKNMFEFLEFIGGGWVKALKQLLKENAPSNTKLVTLTKDGEKIYTIGALQDMFIEYQTPQDITYITDIAPTVENIEKAVEFAENSKVLIIESVFNNNDIEHAMNKKHLAIPHAKDIFVRSGSESVRFMHFAPRYEIMKQEFMAELYEDVSDRVLHI